MRPTKRVSVQRRRPGHHRRCPSRFIVASQSPTWGRTAQTDPTAAEPPRRGAGHHGPAMQQTVRRDAPSAASAPDRYERRGAAGRYAAAARARGLRQCGAGDRRRAGADAHPARRTARVRGAPDARPPSISPSTVFPARRSAKAERVRDQRPRDDWKLRSDRRTGTLELGEYDEAFAAFPADDGSAVRPPGAYARSRLRARSSRGRLDAGPRCHEACRPTPPAPDDAEVDRLASCPDRRPATVKMGKLEDAAREYALGGPLVSRDIRSGKSGWHASRKAEGDLRGRGPRCTRS